MSYLIPVTKQGEHEIVVTHIGEENGEVVEVEESATFNIQAMIITIIDIIPGCIGVINVDPGDEEPPPPPCAGLVGTWFGSSVEVPGPWYVDAWVTIRADGSFESLLYNVGGQDTQEMSMRGTYICDNGTFVAHLTDIFIGGIWVPPPVPMEFLILYTLNGDILILHQDFDQLGEPPYIDWNLFRQ